MKKKRSMQWIVPLSASLALLLGPGCGNSSTTPDGGGLTADTGTAADKGATGDGGASPDKGAATDGGAKPDKGATGDGKPAADKGASGDGGGSTGTGTIQGTFDGTAFNHTCSWTGWHVDNQLLYTGATNGMARIYCAELKNGVAVGPKVHLELLLLHPASSPAAALPASFDYKGKDPMGHYTFVAYHAGVSKTAIMSVNNKNLTEIRVKGSWSSDGKNGHFVVEVTGKWAPDSLSYEAEGDVTAKFDVWIPKK
ncbi:MAG: hypothetical protein IT371_12830 [Deltaproteobacteria bacterium]|nr:hypothetical protein [Deltaproteobacteria bacterium]